MTVEEAFEDFVETVSRETWALTLVQSAAFYHLAGNAPCVGFTMASSGRAFCGQCGWQLSGRMADRGEERSARFALFALAMIGATFEAINTATFKTTVEAGNEGDALQAALAKFRTQFPSGEIENVTIRQITEEGDVS